jgi:TetR/AcrR family transcriptional regulator, cholesterol catabolism regulator
MRDSYEKNLRAIVEDGRRTGEFFYPDSRLATYAIVAIGTHVSSWYSPRGALTLEQVASAYADFILRAMRNAETQVAPGEMLAATLVAQ